MPWADDALQLLAQWVAAEPVLVQISAAKRWRDAAEALARRTAAAEVGLEQLNLVRGRNAAAQPLREEVTA
jgi:chlorophyllide a reductase subunit Z